MYSIRLLLNRPYNELGVVKVEKRELLFIFVSVMFHKGRY